MKTARIPVIAKQWLAVILVLARVKSLLEKGARCGSGILCRTVCLATQIQFHLCVRSMSPKSAMGRQFYG